MSGGAALAAVGPAVATVRPGAYPGRTLAVGGYFSAGLLPWSWSATVRKSVPAPPRRP